MQERVKQRWIANLMVEAELEMPALPWTRAAKRARRAMPVNGDAQLACG